MTTIDWNLSTLVDPETGAVSPHIFVDPEIYRLELERVFARSWLFVAHESEIPSPGDYVARLMGTDNVIASRGADGAIRVMLNACRHRGRRVCLTDVGKAARLTCPYHGWTYAISGELVGVPFLDAYQGQLDLDSLGLLQAPRVDSFHGMVFASWDATVVPLPEYLGPLAWIFDLLFARTAAVEVVGPPIRWIVPANWKLGAANFAGDGHHVPVTHGFVNSLGLKRTPRGRSTSYVVPAAHGHVGNLGGWPPDNNDGPFVALPEELWPEMAERLTPDQFELMRGLRVIVGNVFPNLSFLETAATGAHEWAGPADLASMSFLTVRLWQPRGPDSMEVWTWQLMDRDAPDWWKESSRACYLREFGPAGMFEQDDVANWAAISDSLRSPVARSLSLHYGMGLDAPRLEAWPGPGLAYTKPSVGEISERLFYGHWHERMLAVPSEELSS